MSAFPWLSWKLGASENAAPYPVFLGMLDK